MYQKCLLASPLRSWVSGQVGGELVEVGQKVPLTTGPGSCHLTNTAHSKSVRTLLVEVTSLKRRYCLKLPSTFLPFLGAYSQEVCHLCRRLQGCWSGGHAICGGGHLTEGWLPRRTQGGTGRRGGISSRQSPEEDDLGQALKCHHSMVWHKSHPN